MNTKNNARRRESREKLEKAFVELLQTSELSEITVSELCHKTGLNRSTFYANYLDVYDLADKLRDKLAADVAGLYDGAEASVRHENDWVRLFTHIKENQLFFKTYFKLGYDRDKLDLSVLHLPAVDFPKEHMEYHIEFFRAGLNAMIKKWLDGGCREEPQVLSDILKSEYTSRT